MGGRFGGGVIERGRGKSPTEGESKSSSKVASWCVCVPPSLMQRALEQHPQARLSHQPTPETRRYRTNHSSTRAQNQRRIIERKTLAQNLSSSSIGSIQVDIRHLGPHASGCAMPSPPHAPIGDQGLISTRCYRRYYPHNPARPGEPTQPTRARSVSTRSLPPSLLIDGRPLKRMSATDGPHAVTDERHAVTDERHTVTDEPH